MYQKVSRQKKKGWLLYAKKKFLKHLICFNTFYVFDTL